MNRMERYFAKDGKFDPAFKKDVTNIILKYTKPRHILRFIQVLGVCVCGWVRNRDQLKNLLFAHLSG